MYEREANEVERAATVINLTRWPKEQALGWTETPLFAHPSVRAVVAIDEDKLVEILDDVDRALSKGIYRRNLALSALRKLFYAHPPVPPVQSGEVYCPGVLSFAKCVFRLFKPSLPPHADLKGVV